MKGDDVKAKPYPTLEEMFAAAAKNAVKSRVPPHPPEQARVTLLTLLDRWETLSGMSGQQVERTELAERILNVFSAYPNLAPGWQRAWKALRPGQEEARR